MTQNCRSEQRHKKGLRQKELPCVEGIQQGVCGIQFLLIDFKLVSVHFFLACGRGDEMCDAYLSLSLWTCPHLVLPLSSFSPSPLSTVVLSVTS